MTTPNLAYILQANKETPIYLCVMNDETKQFHKFEISPLVASRLAAECAAIVNDHLGVFRNK
jgi:hypothetical protein